MEIVVASGTGRGCGPEEWELQLREQRIKKWVMWLPLWRVKGQLKPTALVPDTPCLVPAPCFLGVCPCYLGCFSPPSLPDLLSPAHVSLPLGSNCLHA